MTRRAYISTADFRAPYDPVDFQGIGQTATGNRWPRGRSYWTVANFHAPYDDGYFQDNQLFGVPSDVNLSKDAPALVRRFVVSGEPVPSTLRDVATPLNQVNRWLYAGMGAAALFMAHRSYKRWKKEKGKTPSGQS